VLEAYAEDLLDSKALIWEQLDVEPMLEYEIRSQKVTYFGHVVRRQSLEHMVMLGMKGGRRKRGRPRTRWINGIAAYTGMNVYQMVEAAEDRKGWRSIVQAVARGRHRLDSTR